VNKLIYRATITVWQPEKLSGLPYILCWQKLLRVGCDNPSVLSLFTASTISLLLLNSSIVVAAPQNDCQINYSQTTGISSTNREKVNNSSCVSTTDSLENPEKTFISSECPISDNHKVKLPELAVPIHFRNELAGRQDNIALIENLNTPVKTTLEHPTAFNSSPADALTSKQTLEFLPLDSYIATSCAVRQSDEQRAKLDLLSSTSHPIQIAQDAQQRLSVPTDGELGELRLRELEGRSQSDIDAELGRLRIREIKRRSQTDPELGIMQLRESERQPTSDIVVPPPPSPQLGSLLAQIGYFQSNNIFSGVDPTQGGLLSSGITLITTPKLGENTDLIAAIDGSLIRYIEQSESNYNQVRFRAGIRQRLSPQMFGEVGWINQQLFRSESGNRFLDENALRFVLRRRDRLTDRLRLDSLYELRLSDAEPETRSRIINSLLVSLSYNLQSNFLVGLDYQFALSDFTQRDREDQFHRLLGRLTYAASRNSQFNLQAGVTLGGSSDPNVNFDNLFLSVTYTVELGRF